MLRILRVAVALVIAPLLFAANDARPVVGPGATKDDVIKAYGWPNGISQSGTKEIFTYAQGDVILEHGRVERVNFSPDVPWQPPRPRPPPATASTRKVPEAPIDYWLKDFRPALEEAQRRQARILALFTGSDWSPASRQFHDEVEYHADFIHAFAGDFVFVKLDYPRGNPVPVKISDENLALRDRYNVTTYPTLLVLSPRGDLLTRVDLDSPSSAQSFRERVIAAVREARRETDGNFRRAIQADPAPLPPPPIAPAETPPPAASAIPTEPVSAPPSATTSSELPASPTAPAIWRAGALVAVALIAGVGLVGFFLWRLWRQPRAEAGGSAAPIAGRFDAVASGMPLPEEMAAWPRAKVCAVTAALAEFDDYAAQIRPAGGDVDIELRKRGDVKPRVLVACSSGDVGAISARRLRELFGSMAAEGVDAGWFVCAAGFTHEAQEYAKSHRILLVGSDGLHNLMREVPPVSLPEVLARA